METWHPAFLALVLSAAAEEKRSPGEPGGALKNKKPVFANAARKIVLWIASLRSQ
jgi:hypothetical protein